MTVFAPDVFGASILGPLRESLVFAAPGVVSRDYGYRDERPVMDQAKTWTFDIDDADTAGPVLPVVAAEVGRSLADVIDQHVASRYPLIANVTRAVTVSRPANVMDNCLLPLSLALDEAGAPFSGRYVIVPPAVYFSLRYDPRFVMSHGPNGLVGRASRFDVRLSNNCAQPTTGTYVVQAGVSEAIVFAEDIDEIEVRRSTVSPDQVHGVARYGCHVAKPDALACCQVSVL